MRRLWLLLLPLLASLPGAGCQLERLFPEKVAPGVARLTVRNAATLVALVDQDSACGFSSEGALAGYRVEGETGGPGSVTWRVEGCTLEFGELHEVSKSCNDVGTLAAGRAVVDAVRTVRGTLTGNPAQPVIPAGPDAVEMTVDARFEGFLVRFSDKDNALTIDEGRLSFRALPHLAKSASAGVCAVSTSDLTLEEITWEGGRVVVEADGRRFPAEVPSSRYDAQVGAWGEHENWFSGELTVWEDSVKLPHPDDPDQVLDPDYDADEHLASFSCKEDLALPVTYACESLTPRLAQGAAQLTVSAFGNIVSLVDDHCFLVPTRAGLPEVSGEVGRAGAEARYVLDEPCVLDFPTKTPIKEDCHGVVTYAEGRIAVAGEKVVRGIATGDPTEPIVPQNDEPGTATVRIDFSVGDGFRITDSRGGPELHVRAGTLSGSLRPKTALDTETGACSIKIPVASFEGLSWEQGVADLVTDGNTFRLDIDSASLDAQSGLRGARENYLAGSIAVNGEALPIPVAGEPILDPEYDREGFIESFSCPSNLRLPEGPADCSFGRTLGENAARLATLTAGTLASMVNSDSGCGFESYLVLIAPSDVQGEPGEMGSMSWDIEGCELGSEELTLYASDCSGGRTFVGGRAVVDASRTVVGERDTMFLVIDSIVPRSREAVEIVVEQALLEEVVAYQVAPGASLPPGLLTLHSGTLSAVVTPILGERESEPGTFDVPTPVAVLGDVRLDDAEATLEAEGKTFHMTLDDVRLSARAGVYQGEGNVLSGSLRVNGELITLDELALNPAYDQAASDQSYACTEDLRETIPAR